jgi:hypothetical protein
VLHRFWLKAEGEEIAMEKEITGAEEPEQGATEASAEDGAPSEVGALSASGRS